MRLSQFTTTDGTKNWGIDTSTVANYDHLLAAYGDYVYCQGDSEETIQKRARADGALVWQKDFNIYGHTWQKILVDNQGNIYTQKSGNVYKYNSDGNLIWTCDVIAENAGNLPLKDCMIDGSKIAVATVGYIYIINSSGEVELTITDGEYYPSEPVKFDSVGDVVVLIYNTEGMAYMPRKYNGITGAILWTSSNLVGGALTLCVDISNNVWAFKYLTGNYYLVKLGKNTGNVLTTSADTMTATVQEILPVSNGNIAVVSYNSGTDVLTIDIRDSNAIQLDSETHSNITEYNSAVIAV